MAVFLLQASHCRPKQGRLLASLGAKIGMTSKLDAFPSQLLGNRGNKPSACRTIATLAVLAHKGPAVAIDALDAFRWSVGVRVPQRSLCTSLILPAATMC